MGRAINETGERLAKMKEAERPGLVIFVINTDGLENSSREFTKDQIKEMIEHQQKQYKWHFTFLGADQDAFAEAGGLGIPRASSAAFSSDKYAAAYDATSAKVGRMRSALMADEMIVDEFTDEERKSMK